MNARPDPEDFPMPMVPGLVERFVLKPPVTRRKSPLPLGQILVELGCVQQSDVELALASQMQDGLSIGQVLLARGVITQADLMRALSVQYDCQIVDLAAQQPDPRLAALAGFDTCLRHELLPWRLIGLRPILVTARPERFAQDRACLPPQFRNAMMALAPPEAISTNIAALGRQPLAKRAETRTDPDLSSRDFNPGALSRPVGIVLFVLVTMSVLLPVFTLTVLSLLAACVLALLTGLKLAALFAALRKQPEPELLFTSVRAPSHRANTSMPTVSLLVPLYREKTIAPRLIRRLGRLDYPPELLDICLIVEEDDLLTRNTLEFARLSPNMRVITVPHGHLKTKPRALNYALDFARGTIIGVLDAEDAPAADQIRKAVRRFEQAPYDLACLQGVLDFYNPATNFLARAFTLEYASWFRIMLPGLERLGLVVPLGGTTLYLRREALEHIGGWDAHNVTEDADLGVRLARMGYRTEFFDSVTEEEANCRLWPWVKQRARWLKGYCMTWAVHMRDPRRLHRELGAKRFWGVQALFLGTILHFLTLPLLISFWLIPLGLPHPLAEKLPDPVWLFLVGTFITTEIATLAIAATGAARAGHKRLWPWIPLLHLYFPLAAIAAYRAIWDLAKRPFHWEKTEHGVVMRSRSRRGKRLKSLASKPRHALPRPTSDASRTPG